jgi:MoaA/NifB/PqqE/SkfB family radical SAM enzyme
VFTTFGRRARRTLERTLARQASPVRRFLILAGRDRAPHLPEIVQIETTNICNAKCVFCPRDEMRRPQGVMDDDLFRKVADECAALGIGHVRLHNYGEPFVDRRLVEKIAYVKGRGMPEVGLISNGSLLTEEVARGVVGAGLDAINISVDAAGREIFEQTRVGLSYEKVIANIERLVRIRDEAGSRRPRLILSFVRRSNSDDERSFIERWRQVADKIHVTDLHNWAGTLGGAAGGGFPCYRPWLTFTVLWDGRVALCCADFDGRVTLGDMRTSTLGDIWNSDTYRRVRLEHLRDGGPMICRSCDLPKKDSPLWIRKILAR